MVSLGYSITQNASKGTSFDGTQPGSHFNCIHSRILHQPEKVHKTIVASGMEKQLLQYKQG